MLTLVANSRWKRLSQLRTQTSMICGGGEESQQTVGQQGTVIRNAGAHHDASQAHASTLRGDGRLQAFESLLGTTVESKG